MNRRQVLGILELVAVTAAAIAVVSELSKPRKTRTWHGMVAGLVPYDFRPATLERILDCFWNPGENRILVPEVFGVGWAINFYALFESLGLVETGTGSEEDFLMPTPAIKKLLLSHRESGANGTSTGQHIAARSKG